MEYDNASSGILDLGCLMDSSRSATAKATLEIIPKHKEQVAADGHEQQKKSFFSLTLSVQINRELVPSKTVIKSVAPPAVEQLIPRKAARKMRILSGEHMLDRAIHSVADRVAEEYARLLASAQFGEKGIPSGDPAADDAARTKKLFYDLSTNGGYTFMRNELKQAITKYVSEHKSELRDANQDDVFYSRVYDQVMKVAPVSL